MPNHYYKHCKDCDYNLANGFAPTEIIRPKTPLSVENNSSKTLLVFQAPGYAEWSEGKPICSENVHSAAARIRNALKRLKLNRQDFNITNAVQCLPNKAASGRDKSPTANARKCCLKWLKIDIESTAYRKIVVFGRVAEQSVGDLGYSNDKRFSFLRHPSGGLSNEELDRTLEQTK